MQRSMRALFMAATVLTPTIAYAQEAPADDGAAPEQQIVITARKSEERLQEAPTTVSVATADTIDRLGLDNLTDIAKTTPGLVFDDSFGRDANRPVIRGQANILGSSGVAYFIDGIYYSGSLADYDVNTISRVEVVKGPQSALYGRNTYSGAINLISKPPSTNWEGRVTADISEHDRYELSGSVRGPLADGLGISLGGRWYDNAGEFTNTYDGSRLGEQSTWSMFGMLQYDNGGPFTASLRANYTDTDDGQPAIFAQSANANNCFSDRGNLYRGQGRYFCGTIRPQALSSDYSRQFADPEKVGLEATTFNAGFRMDYELSESFTITSLTGYNKRVADTQTDGEYSGNSFNLVVFAYTPGFTTTAAGPPRTRNVTALSTSVQDFTFSNYVETEDWSQELRLQFESGPVKVLLGGYYFHQNDDAADTRVLPAGAIALAQTNANAALANLCASLSYCLTTTPITITAASLPESRNTNFFDITNKAVFGALTWEIADGLSLSAEGRYAEERIQQTTSNQTSTTPCAPTVTNLCPRVVESTFKEFTPRITLSYQFDRDHLIYGVFAEGQKPGGFNGNQAIVAGFPTFAPEDNQTFEVGTKNAFLDGQLIFNLALYHTEIEGYQITQNISVPPNQVSLTRNGGNATVNGFELEMVMRPSRSFTVTANYSYVDAQFTFGTDENLGLINDVADNGLVDCSTGDQFADIAGCQSLFGSIIGKRIPRAPEHTIFVDLDWRQPIGSGGWSVFAGTNISMVSSSFDQVLNFAETGGSVVMDARLGFQNDRYKIQFYVKNLTDEDSVQQIIRYADANADLRRNFIAGLRPARRFGVTLSAGF
jgi:iron complex outermembrane recepter protein